MSKKAIGPINLAIAAALAFLAACPDSSPDMSGDSIGPNGGSVTQRGATLTVPPGALSKTIAVNITPGSSGTPAPDGAAPAGDEFDIAPDGTTFALPATVRLPFDPGRSAPTKSLRCSRPRVEATSSSTASR